MLLKKQFYFIGIVFIFFFLWGCQLFFPSEQLTSPFIFECEPFSSTQINIKWYDNSDSEIGYIIERSFNNVTYQIIKNISFPNIQSYIDSDVEPDTTYYYRVRCYGSNNLSGYSNTKNAKTLAIGDLIEQTNEIPGYPQNFSVDVTQNFPSLSDINSAKPSDISVYGLFSWHNFHTENSYYKDYIKEVGWGSLRPGGNIIRQADNSISYDFNDNSMIGLVQTNMKFMLTVCAVGSAARGSYGDVNDAALDTEFIDDFITILDNLLTRYGPNGTFFSDYPNLPYKPVHYVEIWNEPNLHYLYGAGFTVPRSQKARLYAKLLIRSYNYIKQNWGEEGDEVMVVGLSACGGSKDDLAWSDIDPNIGFIELVHQYVLEEGGDPANCYDILSDHPYTHVCPPDAENYPIDLNHYHYSIANSYAEYKAIMAKWGNGNKPVWFTEIGWRRNFGVYPVSLYCIPERLQAAYVIRMYLISLRLGVETAHLIFTFDTDGKNYGFFNYSTHGWYESAYATQNLIKILPEPRIVGIISDGIKGYYAYRIQSNADQPVIVAWNVTGERNVAIPCNVGTYKIVDMLGNSKIVEISNSQINIDIGPYPVYIINIF